MSVSSRFTHCYAHLISPSHFKPQRILPVLPGSGDIADRLHLLSGIQGPVDPLSNRVPALGVRVVLLSAIAQ